ncbi:hypothetical protein Leryth_008583 [Lithospermum erythrorhizon]|nr:hypothetical protein Leryth_008583 [Lithospermum erythrorhizon]
MKSAKGNNHNQEEEHEDGTPCNSSPTNHNNTKEVKNNDKANAIRSKHSVTEQKRRSKINERFQILRDLIPNSDQKRDTASFLSEVIQYVQFLQEKVQKYEGSGQAWSSEPTKLMPWRNSHWRVPNFASPHALKNTSSQLSQVPPLIGRFDENNAPIPSTVQSQHNLIDSDADPLVKSYNMPIELPSQGIPMHMPMQTSVPDPARIDGAFPVSLPRPASDAHLAECPIAGDPLNPQEELTVEGGTISISSAYSQGLLSSLTHALQTGVDLLYLRFQYRLILVNQQIEELTLGIST